VPVAVPLLVTVKVFAGSNSALTVWLVLVETVQVPVPEQPPPVHPAKIAPEAGVAVRVTLTDVV
jgi:hypothetical protein